MYREQNIILGFGENPALDFAYVQTITKFWVALRCTLRRCSVDRP